ncbi:MAG TPA: alkaline phosphatase D family protein [Verrucomicrobiae bacterium]|nr:alkaline phosphatase D family protein [Verrucomicrobiae bacterium]
MRNLCSSPVFLLVASLLSPPGVLGEAYLELGPMLGHVSSTEARIWAKASGEARLSVRVSEQIDPGSGRTERGSMLSAASDFMGHVRATRLKPSTRYFYRVLLDGKPAMLPPFPSFVTAPPEGSSGRLRFAFISCSGRNGYDAAAGYADLAARTNVDLLLMLGDNHYADSTDRAKQRPAYYDQRRQPGFRMLTERIPTYAIWDDHDYGPNDSDGSATGKEISLQTFQQFWANPAYGRANNPGVHFKFSRGDVDFFMLDNRYHRSTNSAPDDGTKTMLGREQLAWLKGELAASKAKIKFVASGSSWQTHGTGDSWTSFDRERREIWKFIEGRGIRGVIFLSGDRHFTAGYQVQGKWIEITSGPIGSSNAKTKNTPEMFLHYNEGKLYCVFDVDTTASEPKVALEIYRAGQGLLERRAFTWDEINGIAKMPALPPSPDEPARAQ